MKKEFNKDDEWNCEDIKTFYCDKEMGVCPCSKMSM